MDIPKSRGSGFWEAYRACAEENRVRPDRAQFYVNWAKDFANFLLINALRGTASVFLEYNIIKNG